MGELLPTKEMASYNQVTEGVSRLSPVTSFSDDQAERDEHAAEFKRREEEQRRLEDMESDILGGVWDYLKYETAPGALYTAARESNVGEYDQEFNPFEQDFKAMNDWEHDEIGRALNPEHYELIRDRLIDHRTYEENMQSMGYGQFGIMVAGEALNLTNYILPGTGVFKTMKGVKKAAVASGALQGAANLGETAVVDMAFRDRSATEYLATAALGMGFGALFGGAMPTKNLDNIDKQGNVIDIKARTYAQTHMNAKAAENTQSVGAAKLQADPRQLDPEFEARLREQHIDPNDPLAIAAVIDDAEGLLDIQTKQVAQGLASQTSRTQRSENLLVRKFGQDLGENPEATISKGIDRQSAALEVAMESDRLASTYAKYTDDQFKRFQKVEPDFKGYTNWNNLAFERLHRGEDLDRISPEGNKILKAWGDNRQAVWEGISRKANAAGVQEFSDLSKVMNHISRPYDPINIHKLTGEHGEEAMVKLFQKALTGDGGFEKIYQKYVDQAVEKAKDFKSGAGAKQIADLKTKIHDLRNLSKSIKNTADPKRMAADSKIPKLEKQIEKLEAKGKKWTEFVDEGIDVDAISLEMATQTMARMMKRATSPTRDANMMNTGNQTLMRKIIRESDMDQAKKDAMLHILSTQGRDVAGKLGEDRMFIDMGAEVVSPVTGQPVRITEFFNTDTGAAQFQHMRYWVGRTAMANKGDQYKSLDTIAKNRDAIKFHGDAIGMDSKAITSDLDTYDSLVSQILGEPLEDMSSKSIRRSRQMRKLVQGNALNKVGIPQLGESGRGLAAVGNLITGIPQLAKMLTDIRGNRMSPELVRNLEDNIFGKIGDDYVMSSSRFRGEDLGTKAGMFETALNKMGYAQGILSGWHFIHTAQRKFLMNGLSQKYFNDITRGKMSTVQMNNLGITPQMVTRIKKNMKAHATDVTKNWGRHIPKNLHIEKWEPDVADVFGKALYRKSNNAIQGILIGEIPEFMTKEVGKVMTQFRTFNIASVGKQFRRDIQLAKAGESEPYQAMMFQYATAVMAVSLKIAWNASTSGNPEEYMKEHLNPTEIARQAAAYNGQIGWGVDIADSAAMTILPDAANPLMGRMGYTPEKGVTGLMPAVNFLDKVTDGARGTMNIITGQSDNYKADARAALGWLPLESSIAADAITIPLQDK